jgi:hypothetical protein
MESVWTEFASMGSWQTSVAAHARSVAEADGFPFRSWLREECALVRYAVNIFVLRIYSVCQFHHHRGYRVYAEIWACITCNVFP